MPGFPTAAAATTADDQDDNCGGENAKGVPSAATAAPGGAARAGSSWKAAPKRIALPESGNPVSQKKIFSASGTQVGADKRSRSHMHVFSAKGPIV